MAHSPESRSPFMGSEQYSTMHHETHLPQTAAEFQNAIRQCRGVPSPLGLAEVQAEILTPDEQAKTLTVAYGARIEAQLAGKPGGRIYAPSERDAADFVAQNTTFSRATGAETSAHQVFFATVIGGGKHRKVAVKQFKDGDKSSGASAMVTEWVNMQLARGKGFGAFEPAAMITTETGGYLLTKRRDDFEPLDNQTWDKVLQNPDSDEGQLDSLAQLGPMLARLHHQGGFHGDPQLKNFGVTEESDNVELIDWEAATFIEQPDWSQGANKSASGPFGYIERDLKVLFGSLARSVEDKGVGLLADLHYGVQWGYFKEYVLDPYISERIRCAEASGTEMTSEMFDHLAEIESTIQSYITEGELYMSLARTRSRIAETQ